MNMLVRTCSTLVGFGLITIGALAGSAAAAADPPCYIDFAHPLNGTCPFGQPGTDPGCHMDQWGAHLICPDHPRYCGPYGCTDGSPTPG
ncbi:hypothetical protein [Mycolicibacterium sp. CBMA 226]|uniref:hypothetical protein n=1 Tax=Mycolicibacterium sp. CBMA 226 TaxID=2606611 RepID=UPI0012DF613F|nr:hypothetical protein [Mycolicibacterium sp. CBMA 226]MUL76447.1 hypothetical protein [Mycolicibacterium sp. CBMA 226]